MIFQGNPKTHISTQTSQPLDFSCVSPPKRDSAPRLVTDGNCKTTVHAGLLGQVHSDGTRTQIKTKGRGHGHVESSASLHKRRL